MTNVNNPEIPGFAPEVAVTKSKTPPQNQKKKTASDRKVTLTIVCTEELRKRIKIEAICQEMSISEFVIEAVTSKISRK